MTDDERSTLIVNRSQRFAQRLIGQRRPIASLAAQSYAAGLRRRLQRGQERVTLKRPAASVARPLVDAGRRQVVERSVPRPDLVLPQSQPPAEAETQPGTSATSSSGPSETLSHTRQLEIEQPSGSRTEREASRRRRPSLDEVRQRLTRPQSGPTGQAPIQTRREVEARRRILPRSELVEEPEREIASAATPEPIENVSEAIEAVEPSTVEQEGPVEQTPTEVPPA